MEELRCIKSSEVKHIIRTIKQIQTALKEEQYKDKEYIQVYADLSMRFDKFSEKYPSIFNNAISNDTEKLRTLAQILYFKDKVAQGSMQESEVANMVADKYLKNIE